MLKFPPTEQGFKSLFKQAIIDIFNEYAIQSGGLKLDDNMRENFFKKRVSFMEDMKDAIEYEPELLYSNFMTHIPFNFNVKLLVWLWGIIIMSFSFFSNKECEYFPCHKNVNVNTFNCIFCFCPLYNYEHCFFAKRIV